MLLLLNPLGRQRWWLRVTRGAVWHRLRWRYLVRVDSRSVSLLYEGGEETHQDSSRVHGLGEAISGDGCCCPWVVLVGVATLSVWIGCLVSCGFPFPSWLGWWLCQMRRRRLVGPFLSFSSVVGGWGPPDLSFLFFLSLSLSFSLMMLSRVLVIISVCLSFCG